MQIGWDLELDLQDSKYLGWAEEIWIVQESWVGAQKVEIFCWLTLKSKWGADEEVRGCSQSSWSQKGHIRGEFVDRLGAI